MKKNKMMRIASVLLIAVLLSTCAISGTFAKFASEYEGKAVATVATWAFEMDGAAIAQDFEIDLADTTILDTKDGAAEQDVEAGVIAPGTKGAFNIELKNASQVTAKYTVTVTPPADFPFDFDVTQTGNIAIGDTATITVNWEWPFGEDVDDNDWAGQSLEAVVTIQLEQVD